MNRIKIKRAAALLGLGALLAFGLAGCGGDEAAPATVTPPAPPPAPPPFQPEAVEVALGSSGTTVTLMTTEAGGFTLNGEAFTGGEVSADNGSRYTLSLADGSWSAAFSAVSVEVPLGAFGGTVTVTSRETGGYTLPDGTVVGAGATYTSPTSGGTYMVTLGADGQPAAAFVSDPVLVALGAFGGSLALTLQEDGVTFLDADGAAVRSGDFVTRGANSYVLTYAGGAWSAAYEPVTVPVALGASGSLTELTRAEDGSWWIGEALFVSGGTVTAANGDDYALTLADGVWSALYQAQTLQIEGTALTATTLPDGGGYRVGEAVLEASGSGDVRTDSGMYHVTATADGGLSGARFDLPIVGDVFRANAGSQSNNAPSLSADDADTAANEAATTLSAGGASFAMGDLLGSGAASATGPNIVAGALDRVTKLRDRGVALVNLYNADGLDRTTLSTLLGNVWDQIDTAIKDVVQPDFALERDVNPRRAVDALDAVVEALSNLDNFIAATAKDSSGVLTEAAFNTATATSVFGRSKWEAAARFGALGSTRFGVVARRERPDADRDLANEEREAFAWSTMEATRRAADVQTSGNAYYEGTTLAVDSGRKMYEGDIEMQVRFTRLQVSGLVTNLTNTATGDPWTHGSGGDVDAIFLPQSRMSNGARWSVSSGSARIAYAASAGSAPDVVATGSGFSGRLLGRDDASGSEAVGVWNVGSSLAGAFGAVRGADRIDPATALISDVTSRATVLIPKAKPAAAAGQRAWFDGANLRLEHLTKFNDPRLATGQNPFAADLNIKMSLGTLFGDGFDVTSEDDAAQGAGHEFIHGGTHVSEALKIIREQRNFLGQFIALYDAGSTDALAGTQRRIILQEIMTAIDNEIFGRGVNVDAEESDPSMDSVDDEGRFGGPNGPGAVILTETHTGNYPKSGSRFRDNVVLARIDEVIEALSDREAFEDAFESGGLFDLNHYTRKVENDAYVYELSDDMPFDEGLTPGEIWNKKKNRALVTTDRTPYTRFGAWHRQYSLYAADADGFISSAGPGEWTDPEEWEGFAYSPLNQAAYASASTQGYPGDLTLRYRGQTVAAQFDLFYTGDVEAVVQWSGNTVGGDMRIKISDLTSTNPNYGALRHGVPDNVDPSTGLHTVERAGTFDVRSITFQASVTSDNGKLGFAHKEGVAVDVEYDTLDGKLEPWIDTHNLDDNGKIQYWSGYTPLPSAGAVDSVSDLARDSSITVVLNSNILDGMLSVPLPGLTPGSPTNWSPTDGTSGIIGSFVGQDQDGPLGAIGLWTLDGAFGLPDMGVGDVRTALRGAFGADIQP